MYYRINSLLRIEINGNQQVVCKNWASKEITFIFIGLGRLSNLFFFFGCEFGLR